MNRKGKSLNEIQELELLSALDSRAVSPLKFAYIGDGYRRWIDIAEKSRKEMTIQFEENILKTESLPFILREAAHDTDTINVVDFGCGDGMPMIPVSNTSSRRCASAISRWTSART